MSNDDASVESGASSSKVFLVLGLLGGIAIGGGLGYYYFKNEVPNGEEGVVKKKRPEGPMLNIEFQRIAVPIYLKQENRSRFIGNYFIDLSLQVYGNENQILIKRSEVQLQHAFISAISNAELMREDSPLQLDHEKVSALLKETANQLVGTGTVENVAIRNSMRLSR